jgi:hypothetical protein
MFIIRIAYVIPSGYPPNILITPVMIPAPIA